MNTNLAIAIGERYRLEQLLGRGGMGSVYRAYDRLTGLRLALKLVPVGPDAEHPSDENVSSAGTAETMARDLDTFAVARATARRAALRPSVMIQTVAAELQPVVFERTARVHIAAGAAPSSTSALWARMALAQEFRTLASIRHPNIISVLDYGFVARSQPFFTMELLENARSLTDATAGLPLEQQALLLAQLLRALSYIHRHGILHRDLKPSNVMVIEGSEGLSVKLVDFGLALARSHVEASPGSVLGTLSYMAPELFEGKSTSAAADLFAVGVMAYELFARRHPFDRGDDVQLVASILHGEPDWQLLGQPKALVALLRRLLAKSPEGRPSADEALLALSAAVGIPVPKETAALRESTLQAARFVGREEILATLRAAMETARAGSGQVRLLAGESGVGKSRLMEELRVYSLVQGVHSARGQAVSEGGGAYGVWRDILRSLCLGTELDELDASVLEAVLPDLEVLLQRVIPDAPILNAQAAQLRLVNVIESLFLRQTEPLLLLLEDLHWADTESIALLRRLAPSCQGRPMLILASYRDDERPSLPQELPGCPVLPLLRLSATNIAELCQSMLGEQGSTPELVDFLATETEGNVFFVIEVMRALAEDAGQLSLVASHRLPKNVLTGGIQSIVQRRLARLPAEAHPLIQLAAVAGRQLDLLVLRRFAPQLEPWLYMAADAAVLDASNQTWRFAHDKIRESLLLTLDPAEKQRQHLWLADALESTYPSSAAHAAAVAEHYQRGGNAAKAAFYQVEAGVYALHQGATEQAAALLKQSLASENRALLPSAHAARAYNSLIQAKMALGWIVPCIATYEQFAAKLGFTLPTGLTSMTAVVGAMLSRRLRKGAAGVLLTDEDRRTFSDFAQATRWASEAYIWAGQPIKSVAVALQGTELAAALGNKALQSYFMAMFSYLAGLIPLRRASAQLLKIGSQMLDETVDPRAELDFRRVASARHFNDAKWELAKTQIATISALARQVGDEYALMFGLSFRALVAFRQGDESAFESAGQALYERARRNQSDQFLRNYPLYQGIKALRRGEVERAARLFSETEGYVQKSKDLVGRILLGGLMALCQLRKGDQTDALRRARETMELVDTARLSTEVVGEGIAAVVELYLELEESASAADRQGFAGPLHSALSALRRCAQIFPAIAARAFLWHGRYAWNLGAGQLARRLAEASERRASRLGMPYDEGLAQRWRERFISESRGAEKTLTREVRGVFQLLTRSLG